MKNSMLRILILITVIVTMMTSMVSAASYLDPMETESVAKDLAVRTDVALSPSNATNTYKVDDRLDIDFSINHIGKGDGRNGTDQNKDLLLAVYEDSVAKENLVYYSPELSFGDIHKVHLTSGAALELTFDDVLGNIDVTAEGSKTLIYHVFDYGVFGRGWEHTLVDSGNIVLNIEFEKYTVSATSDPANVADFTGTGNDFKQGDAFEVGYTNVDDAYEFVGWSSANAGEIDGDDVALVASFKEKVNLWVAADDFAEVYFDGTKVKDIDQGNAWKNPEEYYIPVDAEPFIAAKAWDVHGQGNIAGFRLVFKNDDASFINTNSTWWVYYDEVNQNAPADDADGNDWNDKDYSGSGWKEVTLIKNPETSWANDGKFPAGSNSEWVWSINYDVPASAAIDTPVYLRTEKPAPVMHTVSFDSDGGTPVSSQSVEHGDEATEPAVPTRGQDTLLGWYEDLGDDELAEEEFEFNTAINSNVNLVAQWHVYVAPQPDDFVVSFNSDGGTEVAPQNVVDGELATEPTDPTRDRDTFLGWVEYWEQDGEATESFDFTQPISGHVNLIAKWDNYVAPEVIRTRTVTYNLSVDIEGEGSVSGAGSYKDGATATVTASAAEGYMFEGFVGADEDGKVLMDSDKEVTAIFVIEEEITEIPEEELPEAPGEDILDEVVPEGTPDDIEDEPLPQTGGLPLAVYAGFGLAVSGFGVKLRKRK